MTITLNVSENALPIDLNIADTQIEATTTQDVNGSAHQLVYTAQEQIQRLDSRLTKSENHFIDSQLSVFTDGKSIANLASGPEKRINVTLDAEGKLLATINDSIQIEITESGFITLD